LTIETLAVDGSVLDSESMSGDASPSSSDSFNVTLGDDGRLPSGSDSVPPTTTATADPSPNAAGWNRSNVTVTLAATDNDGGSGVQSITMTASGAQPLAPMTVNGASTSLTVSAEGTTILSYFATDKAGNVEP